MGYVLLLYFTFALFGIGLSRPHNEPVQGQLPIVDLGYELHQALSYNATSDTYKFSNIRYAQPPLDDLRVRAPLPPKQNRQVVQNGSELRTCPQGAPTWQTKAFGPIGKFTGGEPFTVEKWEAAIASSPPFPFGSSPPTKEDCLLLDVHVPQKLAEKALKHPGGLKEAPVLVWIHGGEYVLGSKSGYPAPTSDPLGLLRTGKQENENGIIFVAINYRLGALGFLSGSEVKSDGDLNAGLLDQSLALECIQKYIHLFGGCPDRVTIVGESAGGGSVMLQMAAFGGKRGPAPFSQAIPQSPAFFNPAIQQESVFTDFLSRLNVTTLSDARKVPSSAIIQANSLQVGAAPPTTYLYYPVVDNSFIPESPNQMFKDGTFEKSVKVLAAHNSFEGGFFFDLQVKTDEQFRRWAHTSITGLTDAEVETLVDSLYPPQFDGQLGYIDLDTRQVALWGEAVIDCNFNLLGEISQGKNYAYEFGVSPGIHTQDTQYTFNPTSKTLYPNAQDILQQSIVTFVVNGTPSFSIEGHRQVFPIWGPGQELVNITAAGAATGRSAVNETRCAWWQAR